MKLTKVVGMAITALSVAMLALSAINLAADWVFGWPTWLSFAAYLRVVGVVCLLAAIAGMFASGGWGRWGFALLFGVAAYHLLYEQLPASYPTHPEALFGLATLTVLLAFGGMHLQSKAKHWLG